MNDRCYLQQIKPYENTGFPKRKILGFYGFEKVFLNILNDFFYLHSVVIFLQPHENSLLFKDSIRFSKSYKWAYTMPSVFI